MHDAAGGTLESKSPSTGQALGSFSAVQDTSDIDKAVNAARLGYREWRAVAPAERGRTLKEMARRLAAHGEELAWIDARRRKPVGRAYEGCRRFDRDYRILRRSCNGDEGRFVPMAPGAVNFSVRESIGVVGRIIPFNHPFMFCAAKAAAPLAAGNALSSSRPSKLPCPRCAWRNWSPTCSRGCVQRGHRRSSRRGGAR